MTYVRLAQSELSARFRFKLSLGSEVADVLAGILRDDPPKARKLCRGLRAAHFKNAAATPRYQKVLASSTGRQLHTACLTGWHAVMRPVELGPVAPSRLKDGLAPGLRICDLDVSSAASAEDPHVTLWVYPAKKRGTVARAPVPVAKGDGGPADAFYYLVKHLEARIAQGARPLDPLFLPKGITLTKGAITQSVQRIAAAAGESKLHEFTAKALRIGGATDYASLDVSPLMLKLLGRWSSDLGEIYARCGMGNRLAASGRLCTATGLTTEDRYDFVAPGC